MAYPTTNLTGIIGFAKAANVTGGTGGKVVTVNSLADFKSAVSGSTKTIVVLAGIIAEKFGLDQGGIWQQ
ncbi:hypothetical protein SOW02_19355 [Pectobacterium actinidiae]|uniref:hypothetical protein n=1 Tax=Pectobacterium actinidiae TaxID=1507808 RepID=UPI002A7FE372|nr:hypothetical protein [Pectobacterium actinidiae]MDY4317069.1 hypothetical protein [Pectobacterium actinidiae]